MAVLAVVSCCRRFLAMIQKPVRSPVAKKVAVYLVGWLFLVLVMMIGLRYEVGGDWYNYARQFESSISRFFDMEQIVKRRSCL